VVLPRQIAMFLIRELTEMSLPEIGGVFGAKHHTTILYACKKMRSDMEKNSSLKLTINSLSQEIKSY
jgi:chromosomal replication initiator protein